MSLMKSVNNGGQRDRERERRRERETADRRGGGAGWFEGVGKMCVCVKENKSERKRGGVTQTKRGLEGIFPDKICTSVCE